MLILFSLYSADIFDFCKVYLTKDSKIPKVFLWHKKSFYVDFLVKVINIFITEITEE